ncbi:Cse1-domain-containing protein [Aulographum hederae CBS 113979]|uniref:Cse1-domain-containing protein n=1 Tax=Aulographum hederae CBS 113979 TaxID=1176131 RepID=A0A6G1HCC1_9PEZI|nr:Cse1-domain-containing protein [Aulographum hederae CBS 113979]
MATVDLQSVAQLLQASLDPTQNKTAEATIREHEVAPGFSIALLKIVASENFPINTRLASALYFKNFVRRSWVDEDGNYKLPESEVVSIRQELIGLMLSVPPVLQSQLGEAISVIAESDFYERWDTLVDDLVSRLTPDNATVNNGVLRVAHSIFKRWRPLFRSDALFTEILHVLGKFGQPFLSLLNSTDQAISANQSNRAVLEQYFQTMNLAIKLLYDLSCQDLPELFENEIQGVFGLLQRYLTYENPILQTDDDSESGILEYVKAGIFEVLTLYTQKYEDAFGTLLPGFVNTSWTFLTAVGTETKYDILVSKALQFLTAVAHNASHVQAFNDEQTLGQVIEKVVLPNLALRESDVELFEDEPIEFIRRDLEGSDSDTRRRAATDFLRQLMVQFEGRVTQVVTRYSEHYFQDYAKDKSNNWKSKDTAIYLFSSIAAKGVTTTQGVKTVNSHVNIVDFFQKHITDDLASESHPILTVDAIKFVYTFRNQLPQQLWLSTFPLLVQHLGSPNYVIYTYAAIAVERALTLTDEQSHAPLIPKDDVGKLSKDLLEHLFKLIEKDSAPEKIQENEFLMKCVMRVLIVIREGLIPLLQMLVTNFINITNVIRHNPSNPRFYYYHFESIGAVIRFGAPVEGQQLEVAFYSPFTEILQKDVQEFTPYVFQLFAALLEANPSGALSEYYQALMAPLFVPFLWDSRGNIPALVRLLSSMIQRGAITIVQNNQLEPILGIFQNLVSKKANEGFGFDLLEALVGAIPAEAMKQYFVPMLQIILTRLSNSKTENFTLRFVRFYHFVSARVEEGYGTDFFITVADQVQNDVFRPLYPSIILPETQKLARPTDRKTAVVSLTKSLTSATAFVERYKKGWAFTCEALLKLLINPPTLTREGDDAIAEQDVDDLSFGVGFTQLNTIKRPPKDPFPEIGDVKAWVGQYLTEADRKENGRIVAFVNERLSPEAKQTLVAYMQS